MWGSEPSLQWVDFCGIIVLQFVSHPPSGYEIWFYCDCAPPPISLWLLLSLWMWGIFFGEFQCLPVNDCLAVSCDSSALARGSERTSFYFSILHSLPCPVPVLEKTILYTLSCLGTLIKNQLAINIWVHFWTLNYISLIYMSILMQLPHCLYSYTSVLSFEIWMYECFNFVLFCFQD